MLSYLTPQERLTLPVVASIIISASIDWFRSVVLGGQFTLQIKKPVLSSRRSGFFASSTVRRFGVLGGKAIVSRPGELNLKECYQYLLLEHGTL